MTHHHSCSPISRTASARISSVAACEPEFLPWRHVRHVESYLALNFFDATLGGSAEALARLDPSLLADVEELAYQRK